MYSPGMTELLKTLRLFVLLMCHHPHIQAKLQAEVDCVIGADRFPTVESRRWMPYTEATILEIFRYGSQTPLAIPHKCNKDVVLDGYLIEKGSVVSKTRGWAVWPGECVCVGGGGIVTDAASRYLNKDVLLDGY